MSHAGADPTRKPFDAIAAPPPARAHRRVAAVPLQVARSRRLVQAGADAPAHPGADGEDTLDTAFAIGWDHARHELVPPLDRLCINPQLQQGYRAGRAVAGGRSRPATPAIRRWLDLRLRALATGRAWESVQLTPHYLRQLEVAHCPVTRERLTAGGGAAPTDAQLERLRDDAGYAAGHLATLSMRAVSARGQLDGAALRIRWHAAQAMRNGPARPGGLSAAQWGRLALLVSFVSPLPHDEAAGLPMLLLPPNRLRLFNPAQALQAVLTLALAHDTPNRRLATLRAAFEPARHADFDAFVVALRLSFEQQAASRPGGPARWALEDAWDDRRVLSRWKRLARALSAAECESIVDRCGEGTTASLPAALATEGWALESGGYLRPRKSPGDAPGAIACGQASREARSRTPPGHDRLQAGALGERAARVAATPVGTTTAEAAQYGLFGTPS